MNLFFIGAGNGTEIILNRMKEKINKAYLFDTNEENINKLLLKYDFCERTDFAIIDNVDYYIESASVQAVKLYAYKILSNNKDFITLSTGAFSDEDFRNNIISILENSNSKLYLPSGAIGGIDIINSLNDEIESVTLETRKSPKSLGMNNEEEEIIFSGSSNDAIKNYPKNINVAITLSMAVKSFEKVKVKIISDPKIEKNIHIIKIKSKAGNYEIKVENKPSNNPKTSLLAPLSVIGLLNKLNNKIKVGV